MAAKKQIHLAVWKDRRTDDNYKAFLKLEDAIEKCRAWAKEYERETFTEYLEESWNKFHIETEYDEGPKGFVFLVELQ